MAPTPNPVKVVEVCRVTPTPPTTPIFFYESHQYSTTTFLGNILPKLKHSLSVTLHHYLPLARNLTWFTDSDDKPIIRYVEGDDDAVSLTIAESEADFYCLSSSNIRSFRQVKEIEPFLPNLPASDNRVPVMALQITLFPNKGAVLDGKTSALFMHSWAHLLRWRRRSKPELTPFYDRTIINDPDELEKKYLTLVSQHSGSNNNNNNNNRRSLMILNVNASPGTILGTFQLARPSIENMQKRVNAQWQEKQSNIFHVSAFTITCAYVWVCLVKARKISRTGKVHLGFIVDCRARLDPPILSTYFGNCVSTHLTYWGKPRKVDMTSIARNGAFSLSDSTDGNGGLEIGLMLNKQEIEAFPSLFATGLEAH
ncbi:LOW QUALITY PROTEIN: malonyl-CoA:anthocyanidin 5-O-glucoside-6''-O-malonyltransferase-like [Camellia sinensis]|uniref:LOW QUALITY PROTEIN: malonyl-CoA:anthocyanidin 5-O-glucoside-6''-O-malonyltransferase-like n=1 Tax=Camellia sinensis TaxID=4442 RepID=UPI001035E3BE|nr:LOW QUALITY PROTEIN: malonyl-CoA:anthocyanidin 5-O-glucoside-6''-O-malonyltransferase-like [Camellia sinensis]